MDVDIGEIVTNFKKAYPNDDFLVQKHKPCTSAGRYHGDTLLDVKLEVGECLTIYKLEKSSGSASINSDELKSKAFPFVYDTKSETDIEKRHDLIRTSLKNLLPNYRVHTFIFTENCVHAGYYKACASFKKEYGSDFIVFLT
ncbi:unnamed protein product [Adineta ricciae]|uniref:Uncharacterized protein n=1 Tax=Adineta ricciae TaxID=249248 RepID=A0A814H117_ADIRI|nr:unnamed protein product [Adineta ricciae]CAF1003112.1 unnamed protein product [Adineta ricciae]